MRIWIIIGLLFWLVFVVFVLFMSQTAYASHADTRERAGMLDYVPCDHPTAFTDTDCFGDAVSVSDDPTPQTKVRVVDPLEAFDWPEACTVMVLCGAAIISRVVYRVYWDEQETERKRMDHEYAMQLEERKDL